MYPYPTIGNIKRNSQRPHFIADFLIRSIIRTRLFNDYLGSLTNTPVIQRLPQPFNDYNATESYNPPKTHKTPPQNYSAAVRLCAWTAEKPYIKRFSGIEKVHRNSIKITVDFWRRRWDLNPCAGYPTYSLSRGAPSPLGYFSMVKIKEKCGGEEEIRTLGPLRDH